MKKIMFLAGFILLCSLFTVQAQGLEQFKQQLRQTDPQVQSQVIVEEHGDAATAVRSMQVPGNQTVQGWRVCIFLDRNQNAREGAQVAKKRFEEAFPDIFVEILYVAPDWKVNVGNCLTEEEMIILQGMIKDAFPVTFPAIVNIPLSAFGKQPEKIEPVETTESAL